MPDRTPPDGAASYQAFLVRMWNPEPGGVRHVTVRRVGQDSERHFRSLVDLYAFLDSAAPLSGGELGAPDDAPERRDV